MGIVVTGDFSNWPEEAKRSLRKYVGQGTLHLEAVVVKEAPKVSGNLANTISSQVEEFQGKVIITSKYARYVVEGTGIYGPHRQRIVPKTKKALAFSYGGARVVVRSVKGSKPNPFHERAAEKALNKIIEILSRVEI